MATLKPAAQRHVAELSDDEGCHLVAGTGGQHLDNSKYSAMYLRRHGEEIHQALDVRVNPTTYSEERQQLEVLVTPNVKAALEWYRKENNDVTFDVFNCSWDDLFDQMARAQGEHEARVNRKGNWFKYLWRKAGSKKEAIEPWLQLIPDEYGLSLVRGAIAIVFHIAEKSHEKEKSLLEGFELITETIHNAMSKGVSFQHEPEMHACCQALYDCLVDGIAELIWSLKPEAKGKNLYEKFKNKQEKQKGVNIEGMLKKVQKKSTELDQCAERILARKAMETHESVGHLQLEAGVQRSMITNVKTDQTHLIAMTHETSNDVKMIDHKITYLGHAADSLMRAISERNKMNEEERLEFMNRDREQTLSATSAQVLTSGMLAECFKDICRQNIYLMEQQNQLRQELRRSLTPVPSREEELILSPDELLDILGVSMDTVNDDLRLAIRQGSDFSRKAHEQAQSLFGEPRFESWMGSPKAKLLLVDGNDASAARKMMSPMSHLCAQMSSALEGAHGRDNVILLHFWCSMHTDIDTEARGPRGMVRALLVQLMAALLSRNHRTQFNFGPVREREFIADLKHGNLEALRRAFVELLIMVPRQMPIFVIIDNVAVFENDPFQDDLYTVVSMIGDFVSANRRIIKVLMTCPYRDTSLVQRRLVSRNEHVVLEIGGRGGLGRITEQSVLSHISKDFSDSSPRDYRDVETPEQFRR